jgi:DNA-binding transcriptional MocR family regulator
MEYRYLLLADELENKIRTGKYRAGEKLPSLRSMHYQTGRSMSTVVQAYTELEQRGVIDVRERSGYYVRPLIEKLLKPPVGKAGLIEPLKVTINAMASILDETARNPAMIPFGSALPDPAILPAKELARQIREIAAEYADGQLIGYCQPTGLPALCREIEKRMISWLPPSGEEQVIISGGCMAAISLCLRTVARAGDVILVESPTFLCYLQLIEDLDMRALEIPVDPLHGIDMNLLARALEEQPVAAALLNPNFHNPLGCVMGDEDKKRLVQLFHEKEIPILEDDIYGDLYFGETRPRPLKSFDVKGVVL